MDPERAALEEEIDRLAHDKTSLETSVASSDQQLSAEKFKFEDMVQWVNSMEQRQEKLLSFLKKANNSTFLEHIAYKINTLDSSYMIRKDVCLKLITQSQSQNTAFFNHQNSSRPESGIVIHQDFSNKLRLELSPAASDANFVSNSNQSSNENGRSPQMKISEGDPRDAQTRTSCLLFADETFDLSDTGHLMHLKGTQVSLEKTQQMNHLDCIYCSRI